MNRGHEDTQGSYSWPGITSKPDGSYRYKRKSMTTYTLDEADRKRLTEFLGDCYHPPLWPLDNGYCPVCSNHAEHRTFATPDDRQALCEKLVERGMWDKFDRFAFRQFCIATGFHDYDEKYLYWILVEQPERCCKLIAKFLEEAKR